MAALLIESLSHKKSSFQIAVKVIELLLLSAGLISTILMFKGAVSPYSYDLILSNLKKPLFYFRSWLSSPLYIGITMHFIVLLIVISSLFHHPRLENNGDIEDGGDYEDYDMHSALSPSLSPSPAPPLIQKDHQKHLQETKPKDIVVAAAAPAATATAIATRKSGKQLRTATAVSKNQQDTEDTNSIEKVDESLQEVFSDFSRLSKAKEIKKAPTIKGGGNIRTATVSLKNQQDTKDTIDVHEKFDESFQEVFSDFSRLSKAKEIKKAASTKAGGKLRASLKNQEDTEDRNDVEKADEYFQANFSDFSKLTEAIEIKKENSLDSSPQVITIQTTAKTTTTKDGQQTINGKQNQLQQTKKQLESEDSDEDDTMEATWRAIKEGGTKPQKKQLKKSETWPQPQTVVAVQDNNIESEENISSSAAAWKEFKKSMTFNETVSVRCRGGLRRDPSMNLQDFNQRVEAFITKFNNEMRLQRQESEQRYLDMISRSL